MNFDLANLDLGALAEPEALTLNNSVASWPTIQLMEHYLPNTIDRS